METIAEAYRRLHRMETDEIVEYAYNLEQEVEKLKITTINGYTIEEVITILNGLNLERKLDIKMTMENLSLLAEEMHKDFANSIEKTLKNVCRLGVDTDE